MSFGDDFWPELGPRYCASCHLEIPAKKPARAIYCSKKCAQAEASRAYRQRSRGAYLEAQRRHNARRPDRAR